MKTDKQTVRIKYEKLNISNFLFSIENYDKNEISEYKISENIFFNENRKELSIHLSFDMKSKNTENPYLSIVLENYFLIYPEDIEIFFYEKDNEKYVASQVLRNMRQSSYDTLRGVLFAKTEDVLANNFILPSLFIEESEPEVKLQTTTLH
jgi:hypothetical protein